MKQNTAPVISNEEILPGVSHPDGRNILSIQLMRLRCPEIAREAKPGQFVMVGCGEECVLPRPFSIHQTNEEGIGLLYNVWEGGKGTEWLSRRQKGEMVELFGPLGNGYSIHPKARNLLLVGGGIGIAPLHFLAEKAKSQGYMIHFHEGVNSASQLMLDTLSSHYVRIPYSGAPAAATLYGSADIIAGTASTVDGSAGVMGMATVCIPGLADWANQIFACGPPAMYRAMAQMTELQNKSVQVSLEVRMGCGVGVCYGCTVKTKSGLRQVCRDGPVFDLVDILWDELKDI